ncbi:DUF397 domain-containing protein [Nocardiopsis ganjiahuensis]|uniref:DUF397 domain-containing protein n=1 Tax=Nocardiopsis ganjiahuensis TaxID=239984 RepID=UPI00034A512B|nr:DUF397 domain-containing protein [Nocardiopsis ganjiahuensis]
MMTEGWKKSSYSNGEGGNCLEARGALAGSHVLVRDTQNRELGHLEAESAEWSAFLKAVASA